MGEVLEISSDTAFELPTANALSLTLPQGLSFDQWRDIGKELCGREKTINWWIGDWWAFGQHQYGERAAAAASGIFGSVSFETLRNLGSVSKAFPPMSRQHDVSFTHHQETLGIPSEEREKILTEAAEQSLPCREVRKKVMLRKVDLGLVLARDQVDDDPEYTFLKALAASWNRAPVSVRTEFSDMVRDSDLGVITV